MTSTSVSSARRSRAARGAMLVALAAAGIAVAPAPVSAQEPTFCGPMDVAFVIDTTGSMGTSIDNVKTGLGTILGQLATASGGDLQLALVTFKDDVTVWDDLAAGNGASVSANILGLFASGGAGYAESSDEALNTAINGLDVADRPLGLQTGDFNGTWRPAAVKIAILVTDAPPGGFDDLYTPGVDDVNANARALEAAGAGILISAVYIDYGFPDPDSVAVMMDYATTTGGFYLEDTDGSGTAAAVETIIAGCGSVVTDVPVDVKPTSCPNPFNVGKGGVVPVAILGTADLDVTTIDAANVTLEGVPALRWAYQDVATPFEPDGPLDDAYDCGRGGPDGSLDLTLKFDAAALAAALGTVADGDVIVVTVEGEFLGGDDFAGEDVIRINLK